MQENHSHYEDEDSNNGHEHQETEAYMQDGLDLDTMVLPKTAIPSMEKNKTKKAMPVTRKQALLLTLKL